MCGTLLNALDAIWLAYAVIAFVAFISIPAIIWSANVIWASTYVKVSPDGHETGKVTARAGYQQMDDDEEEQPSRNHSKQVTITIR